MNPSHSEVKNPHDNPWQESQFAPPPAESGAGQQLEVPLAGLNVHQDPTSYAPTEAPHELPPPPSYETTHPSQQIPTIHAEPPQSTNEYSKLHPGVEDDGPRPPLPPRRSPSPNARQQDVSASHMGHGALGSAPAGAASSEIPTYNPATFAQGLQGSVQLPPPPPKRLSQNFGDDDPSNPVHYTRDPHKLVAYLVPFPKPTISGLDASKIPIRFMIYTPPPPPLSKPAEGEKEAKMHKVQRKWQEEVRSAKTSTAKVASWQGVKSKATRGISKAMQYTTTSNLDFLGRMSDNKSDSDDDRRGKDLPNEGPTTKQTVGVEEMVLVYPPSLGLNDQQMREEFVNTMLRTKSKAQKDAVLATGLLPVAFAIDVAATLVWPFGGLAEVDSVWAYASFRGVKTARSVTKRLNSTQPTPSEGTTASNTLDPSATATASTPLPPTTSSPNAEVIDDKTPKLHLAFAMSPRIELLQRYLAAECNSIDAKQFPAFVHAPTETDVLSAVGWHPTQTGGEDKNWEDEQWEMSEVKDDLKIVMRKAAKEWKKWCVAFAKDPEKAMKK